MKNLGKQRFLKTSRAGFSLMEILIALALIALIAGLVITNLDRIFGGSKEEIARLWVREVKTPLMAYRIHVGDYPSTDEGLDALMSAPEGKERRWKGPYIEEMPEDPWTNLYQYRYPGVKNATKYDIWSWGPDKRESDDDIGNW